jgi:signal transduction histidine kinase
MEGLPRRLGLSVRLLTLTIVFVMISEVLIFAPSIGRYRLVYLEEKLASAHLAGLAIDATPDRMVTAQLTSTLLHHVGAHAVGLYQDGKLTHNLQVPDLPAVDVEIDLREASFAGLIVDAFGTLAQQRNRILRVIGPSAKDAGVLAVVVLDEQPLRDDMLDYSRRIVGLSIAIALATASLLYLSLQIMLVRPMRRLTQRMVGFHPERPAVQGVDGANSDRSDELGVAEQALSSMQEDLRTAFRQQSRLAALGSGVSKLGHDLRNILSSMQVLSDRLADSSEPEVRRLTPRLERALNRAVSLTQATLDFASHPPAVRPSEFPLAELVQEIAQDSSIIGDDGFVLEASMPASFPVTADRDQLYRALGNLIRNARLAGAHRVDVAATAGPDRTSILVSDDGPGVPELVRTRLFQPFNSGRPGGTGLGLAIAHDLVDAHGGRIALVSSGPDGTIFRIDLPFAGAIPAAQDKGPER